MATVYGVNVYGINPTKEQLKIWAKEERKTYLEIEIPVALERRLSKMVEKEVKKYYKNKK